MSENLDLARSIYDAWGRGDFSSLDWAHPEVEYVIVDGVEPGVWKGRAEMARAIRNILDLWEHPCIEADEYRELDESRVFVLNHLNARGRTSGVNVGGMLRNGATVLHIRDRKVTKYESYWDRDRALRDLGLADG
jgi:ketosteroid isomerase-like protein